MKFSRSLRSLLLAFLFTLASLSHCFAGYEVATGTINIGTGAIGTNYSVTGVTPATGTWKALKLTWSGRSETTDASGETDIRPGIGFAVSSTSRRAVTGQSDHGPTTTATDSYQTDANVVVLLDIAGAVSALADFVSFNSDGFTLTVDDVFPAALEVSYVLLGGTDLTDAEILTFQLNTVTGSQDITTGTFQGDFALFAGISYDVAPPSGRSGLRFSIGAATATSQAVLAIASNDAAATSNTGSYCRSGEIFARVVAGGSADQRVSFTQFLSNGFRINVLEQGTAEAFYLFALVLKGGSYAVENFLTAINLNNFTESIGFTPKGVMFFSANRVEDAQDVSTDHAEWSVGAASSATAETAQYVRDKDASANADTFSAVEHDSSYINASSAATQAIEGLGHVVTFADPLTYAMTDADPAASFVWYVALGNTPTAARQRTLTGVGQ